MDNLSKLLQLLSGREEARGTPQQQPSRDETIENNVVSSALSSEEQSKIVDISNIIGHTIEFGKFATDSKQRHISKIFADEMAMAFQVGKYKPYAADVLDQHSVNFTRQQDRSNSGNVESSPKTKGVISTGIDVGKMILLIAGGVGALGLAIKSWEGLGGWQVAGVLATVGLVVGGVMYIGKNKVDAIAGIIAFGLIIAELAILGKTIDSFGDSIKKWSEVRLEDIGKVGLVIGSIGGLIAAVGVLITKVPSSLMTMFAAGGLVAGLIGITYLIGEVIPGLAHSISTLQSVRWEDIGKVGAIFGGLATVIGIIGAPGINVAVGIGEALFAGILAITYGITQVVPLMVDALKYVGNISESNVSHLFTITKSFIHGIDTLFGDSFFSKILGSIGTSMSSVQAVLPLTTVGAIATGMIGLNLLIGKLIDSGKNISTTDIDTSVGITKYYIEKIGEIFGSGMLEKVFGTISATIGGAGSMVALAPIIATTKELTILSRYIKQFIESGATFTQEAMLNSIGSITVFSEELGKIFGFIKGVDTDHLVATGEAFGVLQQKIGYLSGYGNNLKLVSEGVQSIISSTVGLKIIDETLKGIFQNISKIDTTGIKTISFRADIAQINRTNEILSTQVTIQKRILEETIRNGNYIAQMGTQTQQSQPTIVNQPSSSSIPSSTSLSPRQLFNNSAYSFGIK